MRKTFLFVLVLTGMVFGLSGVAFAQDACDPAKEVCPCDPAKEKCEPPKEGDCSPGFYKNHIDFWWDIYCDASTTECSDLLTALTCKGSDSECGRSAAAGFLNAQSGCTED